MFDNLLENAVSFSPDGGLIGLRAAHDGSAVAVRVEDEGPGVPVDAREQVFQRFQTLRPESEAFGKHSGLGLAIARTIVEAHQGTITAGPRGDGRSGAAFVVRLPAGDTA